MKSKKKKITIEELLRRIEALEARPVYPYYPYPIYSINPNWNLPPANPNIYPPLNYPYP